MFGGEFGAFRSRGRHFFNEDNPVHRGWQKLAISREKIALRRGRQYLCEISGDGLRFGLPAILGERMRSVVPWTRLFDDQQVLLAINTDPDRSRSAWVSLPAHLFPEGQRLTCLYSSDAAQIGQEIMVQATGDRHAASLALPAAGFVIFESIPEGN